MADAALARSGSADSARATSRPAWSGWLWILVAGAAAWPWFVYRALGDVHQGPPWLVALLAGAGIVGAAFLLSWAAEAFQLDVSQALAIALLSLIAVLPEYAVSVVFAWRAAGDPSQGAYALANMTGSNRLLIGVGWSAVVLLAWFRARKSAIRSPKSGSKGLRTSDCGLRTGTTGTGVVLEHGQVVELAALAAATLYSFVIPL